MTLNRSWLALLLAMAFPCGAGAAERSTLIILDASGSMNARLSDGATRIDAAKRAVATLVGSIPDSVRLAFRAYGHQSPTARRDCKDTELLIDFAPVAQKRQEIISKANSLKAQGYTPITFVLQTSAGDLKREAASTSRSIILVSDGKETCPGDPCAAARALAEADAKLVIHSIGFAVDAAARLQLQCIARVARGRYFDASDAAELAKTLQEAQTSEAIVVESQTKTVSRTGPGVLRLTGISSRSHEVVDAATGKVVTSLSGQHTSRTLPAGFYHVRFGATLWKSLEVRNGETTDVVPAVIELRQAAARSYGVLDWETKEQVETLSAQHASVALVPSSYVIKLGELEWGPFDIKPGERRILSPGLLVVSGLARTGIIRTAAGMKADEVSGLRNSSSLPPGKYVLVAGDREVPFEIKEGLKLEIRLK
jgi:hypothetical protein